MSLEKTETVDLIEITKNGTVQVRAKTLVFENGEQISSTFHRHMIVPGQDYSAEDSRVKAVCAAVHTPEVITKYKNLTF